MNYSFSSQVILHLGFGFCDFAFGFAQNDRGGRHTAKMECLGLEEPTKSESSVMV